MTAVKRNDTFKCFWAELMSGKPAGGLLRNAKWVMTITPLSPHNATHSFSSPFESYSEFSMALYSSFLYAYHLQWYLVLAEEIGKSIILKHTIVSIQCS